jgi:hypothetical protein
MWMSAVIPATKPDDRMSQLIMFCLTGYVAFLPSPLGGKGQNAMRGTRHSEEQIITI